MPAPTLIATAGAADANTYATLAEANAYHEAHLHGETWRTELTDTKQRALLTATRLLDQHIEWCGSPTTTTQALAWPRQGLVDINGAALSSTAIPARMREATAELARQLLAEDRSADNEIDTKGLTSLTVGPIAMSFSGAVAAKVIPDAVWFALAPWGTVRGRESHTKRLVRA